MIKNRIKQMLLRCPDIKLVAVEVVESMEWMAN